MNANGNLVTITDKAEAKLREIMAQENRNISTSLRMALVQTHCMGGKGFTYNLMFEKSPSEDDEVSEHNGIKVCADSTSASYLRGAELDYVETLNEAGFKINNPNVIARCPCGHHDIFE